jgi:hypothetical protein
MMLIKKQHNLDDSVLAGLIEEIDMRDGQLDGRGAEQNQGMPLLQTTCRRQAQLLCILWSARAG